MKETGADTRTALLQAVGLHAVLFALMFAGLQWTRSNVAEAAQGEVIEADLIDPSALSAGMRSALQRAPEAPQPPVAEPEPVPPEPEPLPQPVEELPPPVAEPEPVEQEQVQPEAESPDIAEVPKEQEKARKQPAQADLDAQKQKRIAELSEQRKQAAQERIRAEMRAQQLADARNPANAAAQADAAASRPRGTPAGRASSNAYIAALQEAILRQWTRPESVELGRSCSISIRQIPGGEVVSVEIAPSCPYDALGRRSVEAAILKASPLPYAGFEDVFSRNVELKFIAEDR